MFDIPASSPTFIKSRRSWYQSFHSSKVCTGNWVQGCCHIRQMLEINLLDQIGSVNNFWVIDVKNHTWSDSVIQSLPSLHPISGCDTVSAFYGIEKATWLSKIQKKEEYLDALRLLGETLELDDSVFNTIESWCVICTVCRRNTELIKHSTKNSVKIKLRIHINYPQHRMNCNNMLSDAIISLMYGNKLYLPILTYLLHLVMGGFWEVIF